MARAAKNSFIFNFKKFPGAFLLALSVILTLYIIELFVLPINFFSNKAYESILVKSEGVLGNFYPNVRISMIEEGGLGYHTKFSVKKRVKWETDRYGYRKRNTEIDKFKIVIIGESDIAGCCLTQEDILSEVLERRLGIGVYPFTRAFIPPINIFLSNKRFINNPPDIVILGVIERAILQLPAVQLEDKATQSPWLERILKGYLSNNTYLATIFDRIYKNSMCLYIKASINRIKNKILQKRMFLIIGKDGMPAMSPKMLFRVEADKDVSFEEIDRIGNIIKSYNQILKRRGIRFIFLPIPNRENIYYEHLPIKKKPVFLERLIKKLQNESIEVVDTQKAFKKAHAEKKLLYHTDDNHWNENGVNLAADLIEKLIKGNGK